MTVTKQRAKKVFPPTRCRGTRWVLTMLFLMVAVAANEEEQTTEIEPSTAILFPWFSEALGVIVFFLTTRFLRTLPFTAIMFLLGTIMGAAGVRLTQNGHDGLLLQSIFQWGHINSEVLLLVFLPGLVFRDAFGMNVRLFVLGINQLILLAFPMVLAGTCLTALVGFYILPYQWSFNLSMTFGSILAATDPVAVSSLLNEVGAPPRLKIHISGESLLNDGSAFVFFVIFSSLFLYELGIPGLGEDIDVARGFAIFFRMSLGGVAFGLAFGFGLVIILYCLNRRLNNEENVIQVAATVTTAYLAYYTADICDTSGIIATVLTGITANAFGSTLINDPEMMENFWILVEYLLQTLLFTLAGTVWGGIIASSGDSWTGRDWGYLLLVYVLVNAIRFFLVGAFYPIFSRIGLRSCWQESVFLGYAGLRGAVGIALALSLDNEVREAEEETPELDEEIYVADTTQLFAMVGGVALLTLVVNGTSSGPVLIKLGLAKSSQSRAKLVDDLKRNIRQHTMDEFVKLMAEFRFSNVDFSVVKYHVPFMGELTLEELEAAVRRNESIATPNLENVLPYLVVGEVEVDLSWAKPPDEAKQLRRSTIMGRRKSLIDFDKKIEMDTIELRQFFLGILRCSYGKMVDHGELDGRDTFVTLVLLDGLEFAATEIEAGKPLKDWEATEAVMRAGSDQIAHLLFNKHTRRRPFHKTKRVDTIEYQKLRVNVLRALAFIHAHRLSLEYFEDHIVRSGEFGESEKIVVAEVKTQMKMAREVIEKADDTDVETLESHSMCAILLNRTALYVESLLESGVLHEREANVILEEIEKAVEQTHRCDIHVHPGHLSKEEKSKHAAVTYSAISHEDDDDFAGSTKASIPDGSTD